MGPPGRKRLTIVPPPPTIPPGPGRRGPDTASAGLGFLDLVTSFCRLRVLEMWAELRSLLHDDAWLESIAARGFAGPGATIEAMRFAAAGDVFSVRDFEVEALGNEAVLVCVPIFRAERDVAAPTWVQWLVSGRDGLIWRSRIVASPAEAERVLREEGPGLGL